MQSKQSSIIRSLVAAAAIAVAMAIFPALASATGIVGGNDENSGSPLTSNKIDFVDYDPEANNLTVTFDDNNTLDHDDDTVTFHDTAAQMEKYVSNYGYSSAFTQCFEDDPNTIHCQADNVTTIRIWTFDGNDTVNVVGDPIATEIDAANGIDAIYGGPGSDWINSGPQDDWVFGHGGSDKLNGGDHDDWVVGDANNDLIEGGPGSDKVDGDTGADDISGGSGEDVVDYHYYVTPITVDLDDDNDDGVTNENDNVRSNIENVLGGSAGDHINGSAGPNIIRANGGVDTLAGLAGDDVLFGGTNGDSLSGGAGQDDIRGESGNDSLTGGLEDDTLLGGTGGDYHSGGTGTDSAQYWDRSAKVIADIDVQANDDGEAGEGDTIATDVEGILGGTGPDELTGSSGANYLYGFDGDDVLTGGLGADTLDGGKGADSLRSNDGGVQDTDKCGADVDSVDADNADVVNADCENVTLPNTGNGGGNGNGGDGGNGGNGENGQGQNEGTLVGIAKRAKLRKGKASVAVTCPATAATRCTGTLTLGPATGKVGKKAFSIDSGERASLKVKVARKLARKAATKGKAKVTASAIAQDDSGVSRTTTAKVLLKPKR